MALVNLNDSQKVLLDILSCSFKKTKYIPNKKVNWQEVFDESRFQAVSLQTLDAIDSNSCPAVNNWTIHSVKIMSQNMEVHKQHTYLHNLFSQNKIDYCIIKGSASAYYYNNSLIRGMGDVDFLVFKKDIEKAKNLLIDNGFSVYMDKHICHIVLIKENMHFELHFEPAGMPFGNCRKIIEQYLEDIFKCCKTVTVQGCEFSKPSDFHHGLIILMHMYHHMLSEGIGLRHLCDWAAFINSIDNNRFKELFENKFKKVGLWQFAQIMGATAHKFLSIDYKDWMGEIDDDLCLKVVLDIFSGGNFGRKDKNRVQQGILISNRGKEGVNKNSFLQFFSSMNYAAETQFPIINKVKILKPLGFILLMTRRAFRVITGKRKMPEMNGTIKGTKQRKQLYKKFHLFETEEN